MPSSLDSVRALGVEAGAVEGGTQTYASPTEIDPKSDALAAAGLHVVGSAASSSNDKTVYVDRTSGGLRLTDANTQRLLSELVTSAQGAVNAHAAQLDSMHFLREGPGEAWPSGSYSVNAYTGCLLTKRTWFTSQGIPIVARSTTYNGLLPQSETLTVYNASGAVMRQVVDTFSYSGVLQTGATRTWS